MNKYHLDLDKYAAKAREVGAEGHVLLKNDGAVLPIKAGEKVAVFGRIASTYYKSGLGSGGLVNTRYVVGILDALQEEDICINQDVLDIYTKWVETHPYDRGQGWGTVPWSQAEMPVTDELLAAATGSDIALVVIGRTAGEDQDSGNEPGSYLLTDDERTLIKSVCERFPRTAVLLNVGNIIDMKWVEELSVPSVMYVWQGGQEGGHATADVLMGRVSPSGRLTDTIAYNIEDYPSTANFGDPERNYYKEDIFVGYRYFETFAKDKVMYPFGFGLSYTTFETSASVELTDAGVMVDAVVTNTGATSSKEVVQVYAKLPSDRLTQPERKLVGYAKTPVIEAGKTCEIKICIPKDRFASYDDAGVTGHKSSWVIEAGDCEIYVGENVRSAKCVGAIALEAEVLETLHEACAPEAEFDVMFNDGGKVGYRKCAARTSSPQARMMADNPECKPYTGDAGIKFSDVAEGKAEMSDFLAQISDIDLIHLFRGEGMSSPKVTPGCGGAMGGLSAPLKELGIPAVACTDGPSGIRLDCGTKAFSLPNGTMLGCTFNDEAVEELYGFLGLELRRNKIDALLGPGMNVHRSPLNGRNFEYISEDPLVTGLSCAAQCRGLGKAGVTGTIKHFACNNQEWKRRKVDAAVSERALREIYLKGFEIAVKQGGAKAVMTSYGAVNGTWSAGNYDLLQGILRADWGYDGFVMTDWWAEANYEGVKANMDSHAPMVQAGNDLFMVCADSTDDTFDDVLAKYNEGFVKREALVRNAEHFLSWALGTVAYAHQAGKIDQEELDDLANVAEDEIDVSKLTYYAADENDVITIDASGFNTERGEAEVFGIEVNEFGFYDIEVKVKSDLSDLAQFSVAVTFDSAPNGIISFRGSEGKWQTVTMDMGVIVFKTHYVKLYFNNSGAEFEYIKIKLREKLPARPFEDM